MKFRSIRDTSIKQKLTILTMLASGVALVLACVAFTLYDQAIFRKTMARDFAILADMFDDAVAPGVAFNDLKAAEQPLLTLSANPHIMAACVYGEEGQILTRYERADWKGQFVFPPSQATSQSFANNRLNTYKEIFLAGDKIGTIYIACDLNELGLRFRNYGMIAFGVLGAASLAAFIISTRLQGIISNPIFKLKELARRVASEKDYSIRAQESGNDELGQLTRTFNEMLAEIQNRDQALQVAHNQLERRVEERTAELANSVSLLNATLDSNADGILAMDNSGIVTCQNSKMAALWNFDADMRARRDGGEMIAHAARQARNPNEFLARIESLRKNPRDEEFDVIELSDGRIFERYVRPQKIDGETVGLVVNIRDITDRKKAEAEKQEMHRALLETSRRAGMAEVATGVLHNVGNVLNSVNTSASVIADKLKKSRAPGLGRLAELVQQQQHNMAAFVTQDDRGKLLPTYLGQLAESIKAEQGAISHELTQLQKNIEHIKDIVAMQQSYAKVAGVSECVELAELVEDSVRMNSGSLERHHVRLVRKFQENPKLTLEKHKVLQILVNLIRNAKYACDDSNRDDKEITLYITRENDKARISVSDNGVGIPRENLTRIFAHGFTTRANGHGFGLHSGALAAKEMGGALIAQSDGPGLGATFILELPIQN
jgi:PAS domain S-box-containing protein